MSVRSSFIAMGFSVNERVSGKLLSDEVILSEWLTSQKQWTETSSSTGDIDRTVLIQCAVGAIISPGEIVKEKSEKVIPRLLVVIND